MMLWFLLYQLLLPFEMREFKIYISPFLLTFFFLEAYSTVLILTSLPFRQDLFSVPLFHFLNNILKPHHSVKIL